MPKQYEKIKASIRSSNPQLSEKSVKTRAARTFIAQGKTPEARSRRAKQLKD